VAFAPIAPNSDVYEYIIFRGSDIKELALLQPTTTQTKTPDFVDPAIASAGGKSKASTSFNSNADRSSPWSSDKRTEDTHEWEQARQQLQDVNLGSGNAEPTAIDSNNKATGNNFQNRSCNNYTKQGGSAGQGGQRSYNNNNNNNNNNKGSNLNNNNAGGNNTGYNRGNRSQNYNNNYNNNNSGTTQQRNPSSQYNNRNNYHSNNYHNNNNNNNNSNDIRRNQGNNVTNPSQGQGAWGNNPNRGRGRPMNTNTNSTNNQPRPNREDNFSKNIHQNVELAEVAEATLAFDKNSIFEQFESNNVDSGIVKDAANVQTKFSSEPFSGEGGDDFFDKVSDSKEDSKRKREILSEQNKLNFETFGMTNAGNNRSGGRGRGRGYKNYNHNNNNNRGPQSRAERDQNSQRQHSAVEAS